VVIIPDMEVQKKFKAQGATPLFADGRMMRVPPYGSVAQGTLREDPRYYLGMIDPEDSTFVTRAPVAVTEELLARGRDRFNIYCAPCHDRTGEGRGLVAARGLVPPPAFWDPRVMAYKDGEIFNLISAGVRTMPGYAAQIPVADRWAIVTYVRALQRAHTATLDDVPPARRGDLR
jgi:mono/diheme cytochrome c family protein